MVYVYRHAVEDVPPRREFTKLVKQFYRDMRGKGVVFSKTTEVFKMLQTELRGISLHTIAPTNDRPAGPLRSSSEKIQSIRHQALDLPVIAHARTTTERSGETIVPFSSLATPSMVSHGAVTTVHPSEAMLASILETLKELKNQSTREAPIVVKPKPDYDIDMNAAYDILTRNVDNSEDPVKLQTYLKKIGLNSPEALRVCDQVYLEEITKMLKPVQAKYFKSLLGPMQSMEV